VLRYQHDDEQAEDVLRELTAILAQAGPLDWREASDARQPSEASVSETRTALDDSYPSLFGRVLELPAEADRLWQPEDLGGLLSHQLTVPLVEVVGGTQELIKPVDPASTEPLVTLADLFRHTS